MDLFSSEIIFWSSFTTTSAVKIDKTTLDSTTILGSTFGTGGGGGAGVTVRDGWLDDVKLENSEEKNPPPPPPATGFGGSFLGCAFSEPAMYTHCMTSALIERAVRYK